jgi:predicted nucleotidyltransferase
MSAEVMRRQARRIAQALTSRSGVDAICLFGSAARGDSNEWSDVDLLVVGSDPRLTPTALLRVISRDVSRDKVTLLYYLRDELQDMFAAGLSFTKHLQREAIVLYDPTSFLTTLLTKDTENPARSKEELAARLEELDVYSDLRLFKDNFLFVLARLYSIGKSVVMLALAHANEPEFRRDVAFARFAERHPELEGDVKTVSSLRPFYQVVTGRESEPLPFSYRGANREAGDAIAAIKRIARVVQ